MKDDSYNGWANYETWAVSLWLDNEEWSQTYWREQAEYHHRTAGDSSQVTRGIWSKAEATRFLLADQLKEEVSDASPLTEPSLYNDLLNAALSEVNWQEVAENLLVDLPPIEEE